MPVRQEMDFRRSAAVSGFSFASSFHFDTLPLFKASSTTCTAALDPSEWKNTKTIVAMPFMTL